MGEAARVFGEGGSVEYKGRTYNIRPRDLAMTSRMEAWLEDRAWARVQRLRGKISEEDYLERLRVTSELINTDTYSHSEPAFAKAFTRVHGMKFCWYLMIEHNKGMTLKLANKIWDHEMEMALERMKAANNQGPEGKSRTKDPSLDPRNRPQKGEGEPAPATEVPDFTGGAPPAPSVPDSEQATPSEPSSPSFAETSA